MSGRRPETPAVRLGASPLLWCARGTGILMFGLVLGVMHNGDWEGGSPDVTEAFERAFLYVLMSSWLVGLRWPSVAGIAGALGFLGLQAVRWWTTGAPSLEPGVLVTALPSVLYLLDARGRAPAAAP